MKQVLQLDTTMIIMARMDWVAFTYSLPSRLRSSPRVTLWRRLGRLGAVSPTSGLYILPDRDECLEAFQWLAQEIRQAGGSAVVMRVARFEGLGDQDIVAQFNEARTRDYSELDARAAQLEKRARQAKDDARAELRDALDKLRRQQAELARVDYFGAPEAMRLASRLARIGDLLSPAAAEVPVVSAPAGVYRGKHWVTRPRPHVDRLACIWLIRRFVDPGAVVRYAVRPERGEVAFDMAGADLGHHGDLCTFETMLLKFGLEEPALRALAEIVHEIDLRDGRTTRPATAGVDRVLGGWLAAGFADAELEAHGVALFEGLYRSLSETVPPRRGKGKRVKR